MGVAVQPEPAAVRAGIGWRRVSYAWALIIALAFSYFVWRIPVQVTDCLANLIQVQEQTWSQSLTAGIGGGYMRPFLWTQIKTMYEAAAGQYYTGLFRAIHVAQVLVCALLFVGLLRVRDAAMALAVPFGIAMLFGTHTFDDAVREAFPVNSFLSVIIAALGAANLSLGTPSRAKDALALFLLVSMLLTVESGVVVWICLVAAWMAGARGVSRPALALATVCLALYMVARFNTLAVGTPDLIERPSGFGFQTLEPQQLKARFGEWPYAFYAYNVLCQTFTVLFSEPRTGVWAFTRRLLDNQLRPGYVISIATSVATTLLIAWYIVDRFRSRHLDGLNDRDRIVFVFCAVLVGNAIVSFPYTKDVIVSAAGAFYAVAATIALAHLLARLSTTPRVSMAAISVGIALLTAGAAMRLVGMCYTLRDAAFVARNEWTEVDAWAQRNAIDISRPGRAALVKILRNDAYERRAPAPTFAEPSLARYFY